MRSGFDCVDCGRPNALVYAQYDDDGELVAEPAYCSACADRRGLLDN